MSQVSGFGRTSEINHSYHVAKRKGQLPRTGFWSRNVQVMLSVLFLSHFPKEGWPCKSVSWPDAICTKKPCC